MPKSLPPVVSKYFWGDDLIQLNWQDHKQYIIETLLERADLDALEWLFAKVSKAEIKGLLPSFKLSAKSANFWQLYLS